jgi:hypothetical protein
MGVRAAHPLATSPRPGLWSLAALVLAAVGVAAATWIVVSTDSDPGSVLWPLVVAPVVICLVPVLVPRQSARIGAAVTLAAWCILTGLSIGFLLLPALAALLGAVVRESA